MTLSEQPPAAAGDATSTAPRAADVSAVAARVIWVGRIAPRVVRVTFTVPGLRGTGSADEWVGIFFGEPGDHRQRRNYTIRAIRPEVDEVDIDFVLHDEGLAADWARAAAPGQTLAIWDQVGCGYDPPPDTDWRLIVGDDAALPAIGRIVEELPAGARAIVVAEVVDEHDRQTWATAGDVELRWLYASGNGRAPSRLEEALRTFPHPPGTGYIWMAGELRTVRAARRHLRHALGLAGERYSLIGYWRTDGEAWMERYEAIAPDMEAIWAQGEADGLDIEEIEDAYDAALEQAGL